MSMRTSPRELRPCVTTPATREMGDRVPTEKAQESLISARSHLEGVPPQR
jgi:hypothetical protein